MVEVRRRSGFAPHGQCRRGNYDCGSDHRRASDRLDQPQRPEAASDSRLPIKARPRCTQRDKEIVMPKTGLDGLLRPEDSVLALVDHQAFQFANLHSHEPTMIVNNVVGLAKSAKLFGVPTILSTVLQDRGGYLIKGIQDVFPEQKPIDRTLINSWQDQHFVEAIRKTGRKQLVLAALWTEICLAMTAIHALADGFDVFFVTDASGGASVE